jgi:signal peptidase II
MSSSANMPMRAPLRWLWLSLAIVVLDLATKWLASSSLIYGQANEVLPVFNLTLLHNTGAAFSFLAAHDGWQRWLFAGIAVVAAVGLSIWLTRLKRYETYTALGIALVLGGALGNLYDRIVHGYVVDFLSFHWNGAYFPAFNVADVGISLGAVALILESFRSRKE